ncbi:MAG: fibronectin type III domain-containing protein [Candidatus Saccharimonadales bacterium]
MSLHMVAKHSTGVFHINSYDLRRAGLWLVAFVLILTTFAQVPVPSANASVALYDQESANGIGSRSVIAGVANSYALDSAGNIFAPVFIGNYSFIRKFAPDGSFIKDIRHTTLLAAHQTAQYGRLAVDNNDILYAFDSSSNLQKFDNNGNSLGTVPGINYSGAYIIFDHDNNFYVSHPSAHKIYKYNTSGTLLATRGTTSGSADGQFATPRDIAIDSNNNLVVSDSGNYRIQILSSTGTFIRKFGQRNTGITCPTQPSLDNVAGITLDEQDTIYVAAQSPWCSTHILTFDINGNYLGLQERGIRSSSLLTGPDNTIYAMEPGVNITTAISRYTTAGVKIGGTLVSDPSTLTKPTDVAQDSNGNYYVVDYQYGRVMKYDSNFNYLLSFGSKGTADGQFDSAQGIAIDSNDNVYVADYWLNRISKFTTNGVFVSKFGTSGSADGQFNRIRHISVRSDNTLAVLDGIISGRVQILDSNGTFLSKLTPPSQVESFALKSDDSITILSANDTLRTYDKNGVYQNNQVSSTLYDSASSTLFYTQTIFYDKFDNLHGLGRPGSDPNYAPMSVARINLTNPDLPKFKIILVRPSYEYYGPDMRMIFTDTNQLLLADRNANYVRVFNPSTILDAAGAPTGLTLDSTAPASASLSWTAPASAGPIIGYKIEYKPTNHGSWVTSPTVATTSTTLTGLLADTYDIRVSTLNEAGLSTPIQISDIAISGPYEFKQKIDTQDNGWIHGMTFDSNGKRYESDYYNDQINVYSADGTFERTIGSPGSSDGQMYSPKALAISNDNKLYVSDYGNDRILIFELDGTFVATFGQYGLGDGQISSVTAMEFDSNNNLYLVNSYESIQKLTKDGIFIERVATDSIAPTGIALDNDGNMYVANSSYDSDHGITKYNSSGVRTLHFGGEGEANGQTYDMYGLIVNPSGQIIVNDPYNNRLQLFNPDGSFATAYGRGYGYTGEYLTFDEPETIVQAANGDIYIPNGWSPYTQVLSYTGASMPPSNTAPSTPQNVVANTATPNELTIDWTAPISDGGSAITNYLLEYKKVSDPTWTSISVAAPATIHTISPLGADNYQIRITAVNSVGASTTTTLLSATVAPTAPLTPTPSTPITNTPVAAPSSPVVPGVATTPKTPTSPPSSNVQSQSEDSHDNGPSSQPQSVQAVEESNPGQVLITWQPPASGSPSSYVIEYRDASIPASDTTTPWRQILQTTSDQHSATIALPAGEYTVRVAALMPGDTVSRVILGTARVKVAKAITESDGTSFTPVSTESTDNIVRNLIVACTALLAIAAFFIILIIWKKRRNKAHATTVQLPPRHWS